MFTEKSQRKRQIPYDTWKLEYATNELIYKTETDSQTQKTDLRLPMGRAVGVMNWELEINRYKQYVKYKQQSHNVELRELYSMHNGKEYEKEYTYMYIYN